MVCPFAARLAIAGISMPVLLATGCATPPEPVRQLAASTFDVTADNETIHLVYGASSGKEAPPELFYVQRTAVRNEWSEPVQVPTAHAPAGRHHRGNDPQLAAHGDRVMALWTARGKGPFGSGPLGVALSNDGGKTWKPGPTPSIGAENGYRFPATVACSNAFHVIWIHAEGDSRSLRYSRLDHGTDRWSAPVIIDPACCACCWNELKIDGKGKLYALYRDEKPQDMALAVLEHAGARWERMGSVGDFRWFFDGCPHVGGGLAVSSDPDGKSPLLASVWTGHETRIGAYALRSNNEGQSWIKPLKLRSAGETGRHTDVALLSANHAAVVWDQLTEDTKTIFIALSRDGGQTWNEPRQLSSPGRNGEYPRIVPLNEKFVVLWSEENGEGVQRLRVEVIEP